MENFESDVSQFRLDDLQLAAELGKSLLERNMELEKQLKACKSKADEQEREILHLRKHVNGMAEENDARLKVYEQLDLMLQELERANQRLTVEKCRDKDQIKLLVTNIEILEARCEQLSHQLNIARQSLDKVDRYRQERHTNSQMPRDEEMGFPEIQPIVLARHDNLALCHSNLALSLDEESFLRGETSDDLIRLLGEMEIVMRDFLAERRRCSELEEQMRIVIQENLYLQRRLAENVARQEMLSVREEVSLLEEVRQGRMCSRCLGNTNYNLGNFNLVEEKPKPVPVPMLHKGSQTEEPLPVPKDEHAGMVSTIITELEHKVVTGPKPSPKSKKEKDGGVLKVLKREPVKPVVAMAAGMKKKNRRKHRQNLEVGTPKKPATVDKGTAPKSCRSASPSSSTATSGNWNGNGMLIYNQDMEAAGTSQNTKKGDDSSYAHVLRGPKTLGDFFPPTFPGISSHQARP